MRVAFFTTFPLETGGGAEKFFLTTASELSKRYPDMEITIVTASGRLLNGIRRLMQLYYGRLPFLPPAQQREESAAIDAALGSVRHVRASSVRELRKALADGEVVYAKNELLEAALLRLCVGYHNIGPVIFGCHTPIHYPHAASWSIRLHNFLYLGPLYRFLTRPARAFHVLNQDDERLVRERFKTNAILIRPPFAVTEPPSSSSHDTFNILFAGRLFEQKGVDVFIDMVMLLRTTPDSRAFTFTVAGSGAVRYERSLAELAGSVGNVTLVGHVPNDRMSEWYAWADAVVIPSRFETVNYVALEAGAAGRVVVATDIPGPRDVIVGGETGYLLPLDAHAFVRELVRLRDLRASDRVSFNRIGTAARRHIAERFDPARQYAAFRQMLVDTAV